MEIEYRGKSDFASVVKAEGGDLEAAGADLLQRSQDARGTIFKAEELVAQVLNDTGSHIAQLLKIYCDQFGWDYRSSMGVFNFFWSDQLSAHMGGTMFEVDDDFVKLAIPDLHEILNSKAPDGHDWGVHLPDINAAAVGAENLAYIVEDAEADEYRLEPHTYQPGSASGEHGPITASMLYWIGCIPSFCDGNPTIAHSIVDSIPLHRESWEDLEASA